LKLSCKDLNQVSALHHFQILVKRTIGDV